MPADVRGYLTEDFRLFPLRDCRREEIDYHYHEFDKVLFFTSGQVTYLVEGRVYDLRSGDILLIPHHQIHQPVIGGGLPYERYLLWLSPTFLEEFGLSDCFRRAAAEGNHLLRGVSGQQVCQRLVEQLAQAVGEEQAFGGPLLAKTYCLQLLIQLNRLYCRPVEEGTLSGGQSDPCVDAAMEEIRTHLTGDLSVDALAARLGVSRSGLMSRFKATAGCTLHQYVVQKRLIHAAELLRAGHPAKEAAAESGFQDYSAFLRAFRKRYGVSPRELR